MNCRSAESLFSAFVEDEISTRERRTLEAHLLQCRKCSLGLRELKATMRVLHEDRAQVAPSPHFDEDLMARIRSGEALRPSVGEWVRGLLTPARLKPAFMAGAAVCAVWIVAMTLPLGRTAAPPPAPPAITVAPSPSAPVVPGPEMAAAGSTARTSRAPGRAALTPATSVVATAVPAGDALASPVLADSILESQVLEQPYRDEVINDLFYLDRGQGVQGPAVVPVNSRGDDGVYITF